MRRIILKSVGLAVGLTMSMLSLVGIVAAQDKPAVPASDVVKKSIKAVGYVVGGGSTKVIFVGTTNAPNASGDAKVGAKKSGTAIEVKVQGMPQSSTLGAEFLTYVLWIVTPDGATTNLGEIPIDKNGEGKLNTTAQSQTFAMAVTAEPYFAVSIPSEIVVLVNDTTKDTKGKIFPENSYTPFVQLVGCAAAVDVLSCLRGVPAEVLVTDQSGVSVLAVIEPKVVPVDPFTVLEQQGFPVPLLIGSTREEATFLDVDPTTPITASQYETTVHTEFDPDGAGVADQVLTLYPVANYDAPVWALVDVNSDFIITCEVRSVALAATGAQRPAVWRYFFTHRFQNSPFLAQFRAFHTAELYFVFGNLRNINGTPYTPSADELELSNNLMGYWTRFAASGDPNGSSAVQWTRYDGSNESILELDTTIAPIPGYHITQCNYLETLPEPTSPPF